MKFPIRYNQHFNGIIGVAMQVRLIVGCVEFQQAAKGAMEQVRNIHLASESSELMGTSKNQCLFCLQVVSIPPISGNRIITSFFFSLPLLREG